MKETQQNQENTEHLDQDNQEKVQAMGINIDENMAGTNLMDEEFTDNITPDEIAQIQQDLADLNDKHLRLNADFENYRKRTAKERLDLIQNAGADVITSLLEVIDDADRSMLMMDQADDLGKLKEGVQLIFHKLKNVLQSQGLQQMDVKEKDFDADLHDAITEIDAGEKMSGKVVEVVSPGYILNDKILRHAKVVVGK